MNDYDSDIGIAMHIYHHQFYWEKKMITILIMSPGHALIMSTMSLSESQIFQLLPIFPTVPRRDQSEKQPRQTSNHVALRKRKMTSASMTFVKRFENGFKTT